MGPSLLSPFTARAGGEPSHVTITPHPIVPGLCESSKASISRSPKRCVPQGTRPGHGARGHRRTESTGEAKRRALGTRWGGAIQSRAAHGGREARGQGWWPCVVPMAAGSWERLRMGTRRRSRASVPSQCRHGDEDEPLQGKNRAVCPRPPAPSDLPDAGVPPGRAAAAWLHPPAPLPSSAPRPQWYGDTKPHCGSSSPAAQLGVCSPSGAAQTLLTPPPPWGRPRPGHGVTEIRSRHTRPPLDGCGTHRGGGTVAGGGGTAGTAALVPNSEILSMLRGVRQWRKAGGAAINRCCYHWRGHCCSLQCPAPPGWESAPAAPLLCLPCPHCGQTEPSCPTAPIAAVSTPVLSHRCPPRAQPHQHKDPNKPQVPTDRDTPQHRGRPR